MNLKSLKLRLVQKIMATKDREVLETIHQLLEQVQSPANPSPEAPPANLIADALGLGDSSPLDQDSQDLQRSIDDIFTPPA